MFRSVAALILSQLGLLAAGAHWPEGGLVGESPSAPWSFLGAHCWLDLPLSVLAPTLLNWPVALGSYF